MVKWELLANYYRVGLRKYSIYTPNTIKTLIKYNGKWDNTRVKKQNLILK